MEALTRVVNVREFEALARASMDPAAFDYVAGGSWDDVSLAENEAAWRRQRLRPRVLVDVANVDPSTTLLGVRSSLPLAIAPMAVHALADPDGEVATARAAAAAGVPFILSTTSSRSMEDVAGSVGPEATRWFQLYVQADLGITRSLVERAAASGYTAVVLTVDLPVLGYRDRDRRSGFQLPPLGNFGEGQDDHVVRPGVGPDRLADQMRSSLTWDDLATIRGWSDLPMVLKGIMTAEDARIAVDHGVDGIVVSNHGARQLDRVPAPVDVLPAIMATIGGQGGHVEVWVDGGVRRGLDIAIALALGARGVLVGRPIFWSLAAGGQAGVERAIAILGEEFATAMALLGVTTAAAITSDHLVAPVPDGR